MEYKNKKFKRRKFLQSSFTALTGGILLTELTKASINPFSSGGWIKIETPFHGAILNSKHGKKKDGGLKIIVEGEAALLSHVTVNGIEAERKGTKFLSEVVLTDNETEITALSKSPMGNSSHEIRVVWDKNSFPRYGFEVDDNIFFLRDIAREKYKSLFDCFYLKGLKNLHQKYGTKFVLNTYFSDGLEYTNKKEFNLTHFPDRYKNEWKDNSHWLKLAFHAYSNNPDRPYQYASANKLIGDLEMVAEEIYRFAGPDTYTPPTVIHWNLAPPSSHKALKEKGVRVLRTGGPKLTGGVWDNNYFVDDIRSEYLSRHDAFMDFEKGIIFALADLCCNRTPLEKIIPTLETIAQNPDRSEIMDIMTHEQYFWPFYKNYIPDHFQRLDTAIRWVTEHGYKPVFYNDGFLGA